MRIARIGIDLEPQLVGRQHLLPLHVEIEHALVDPDDPLDERDARDQAGAGLAEIARRAGSG